VKAAVGKRAGVICVVIAFHYASLQSDLGTYWKSVSNFGAAGPGPAPPVPVIKIHSMGGPNAASDAGWAQELCLDMQIIATVNPSATIWVVEAVSDSTQDLLSALNYARTVIGADVISMSWGMPDSASTVALSGGFVNAPGLSQCFVASTGDANSVSWPAVLSNCVAVGGSTLLWTPTASSPLCRSEFVWSDSGCGYSVSVPRPAFQSQTQSAFRSVPDVCMVGNPNTGFNSYCTAAQGWNVLGGTSLSAPFFAGLLSVANQQRLNAGKPTLTTVSPATAFSSANNSNHVQTLLYTGGVRANALMDVTVGSELGSSLDPKQQKLSTFSASSGFDIPTGLGSPNSVNLCTLLG
jgi:subtilase family serine protease